MASLDRSQPVICPTTCRVYPELGRLDDESWFSDTALLVLAPWFDRSAIEREHIVPRYTVNELLLGGTPLKVTITWSWLNQSVCYDADLYVDEKRIEDGVCAELAEKAQAGFDRLLTYDACKGDSTGMFLGQNRGEFDYLADLYQIPDTTIEVWRRKNIVSDDVWVPHCAQSWAGFRYFKKRGVH